MAADAGPEPDAELHFGHDRIAARDARRTVGELLADDDDPIADSVELVVSELVTNVIRHTSDGGVLRAWDPKPEVPVRVEVEDSDLSLPEAPADDREIGGRGMRIVAAEADGWGVTRTTTGKVVWAEFDRSAHEQR